MKKLRFLIAIVLIFSLLPVFGVSASEQTEEIKATETYVFKKLEAFGIMSESDPIFYYDKVMRGTFISYIMKCYPGYGASAPIPGIENPFTDVDDKTEGVNEISAAAYAGLISGVRGSEFRPNDYITKSEAAKIFVTMLGYNEYAERRGGYPSGYLSVAQTLGIFSGCEFEDGENFTITNFMNAYANVLDTEVLEVRSISVDQSGKVISQDYKSFEERTLLYNAFGLCKAKGIVESNEYTSLLAITKLNPGEVEINGFVYKANDSEATSLLGYNTQYYYKKPKDAVLGEIVYIEPYRNNVVETVSNCIEKSAVSDANFRYYKSVDDNKYQDLKIAKYTTLIHNGEQKPLIDPALLCPVNGTVKLIDNNDDKVYDVIFVMDYRTIMISSLSQITYQVMDFFGGASIKLDPKAEDYDVILEIQQPVSNNTQYVTSEGLYGEYLPPVKNEFSELKVGDIILYAESTTNKKNLKYVKVSRNSAKGKVTSIVKDDIFIDGKKYELSPVFNKRYTISAGEEGLFYLDIFGRIVSKSLEKKKAYGYLYGIDKADASFDSTVRVRIFTESNRWAVLELAKNVKTNITGDSAVFKSLKPKQVYDALNAMPDFRQLITYTVNGEGKLNNITVAQKIEAYSNAEKDAIKEDVFRKLYDDEEWGNNNDECKVSSSTAVLYNFNKSIGYDDIMITDATKVFVICEDNEELTQIEAASQVVFGGKFIPYDINERRIAGAVVIFRKASTFTVVTNTPLIFVQEIIQTTNSQGELVSGFVGLFESGWDPITLVAGGKNVSQVIDLLKKGDLIQVALDKNGEIYDHPLYKNGTVNIDTSSSGSVQRRLNIDDRELHPLDTTVSYSYSGQVCTVFLVDAKGNRIMVRGKDNKRKFIKVNSSTKYYIYDTEKATVTKGSIADLAEGMFIFVKRNEHIASHIIVYK